MSSPSDALKAGPSEPPFTSRALRDALGQFATGITLVTIPTEDGRGCAITVNSFASVSLEPPLVLWSIGRNSDRFEAFQQATHFAVNVLSADQVSLSERFARTDETSLVGINTEPGAHGVPLLAQALARFECVTEQRLEGGDHVIMLGRVLAVDCADAGAPLLYLRGQYRRLEAPDAD